MATRPASQAAACVPTALPGTAALCAGAAYASPHRSPRRSLSSRLLRWRWSVRRALLGLVCTLAAASALAAPSAYGFEAGQLAAHEIPAARLVGHGTFSRMGFHLYDAELFIGPGGLNGNWANRPLVLDLRYAHSFKSHTLVKQSLIEMGKLQVATDEQRQAWGEALAQILPDVAVGQHLTGVFRPGDGTRFYSDGRLIGQIAGDAFARAFFAIWLDPRTSAPDLRAELISDAR